MKVYKIDFSFDNNEPVFGAKENFKIENSKFTKEEIEETTVIEFYTFE